MAQPLPFFFAHRLAFWSSNRHIYRVYILPHELLFLKIGTGSCAEGALWGGELGTALAGETMMKQIAEKLKQFDEADEVELRRLASSDPQSFAAVADELAELRLEAPPAFYKLAPSEHAGELCFTHQARGKYRLALFGHEAAKTAYQDLPKALGEKIAVNAVWNDMNLRLVKKP